METHNVLTISRSVYSLDEYNLKYASSPPKKYTVLGFLKRKCSLTGTRKLVSSYLPILKVIRQYNFRSNAVRDLLAGLTVSFLHLPQGLAFGLLASLQPVNGLYSSFFQVLFYMVFGTSPYVSYGPTANMAILTRVAVEREASTFISNYAKVTNSTVNLTLAGPSEEEILQVKIGAAASCSVLSGLILAVLGFFRLGFLTSYLSTSFIGGFTTAAAIFVASSQLPKLFGINVQSNSGVGGLVLNYVDLFKNIQHTKSTELLVSAICITILLLVKICVNERFRNKLKLPIPIDFILAVAATVISYFANLEDNFGVIVVGDIPSGFTAPVIPTLDNAGNYLQDAVVIALVSLAMTITFAKQMAKKHGVEINESQELFAYGASNVLSGFFGCFPAANASPRTGVLSSLGARTTLHGVGTVTVFLLIILVVGKLFVYLPNAVLASMIIVATKDLILQYSHLPKIWRINKYDFIIWLVTNSAALLLDLFYGFIIGLFISILLVVIQSQMEVGYLMRVAASEDVLYRSEDDMHSDIKVFKFPTNLYFATAERFKKQMYKIVFDPEKYSKRQEKRQYQEMNYQITNGVVNQSFEGAQATKRDVPMDNNRHMASVNINKPDCIIIDCTMITYMDLAGSNILQDVTRQYRKLDITVYLSAMSRVAVDVLTNSGFFRDFPQANVYFDTMDAIQVANTKHRPSACHL